MVVLVCVCFYYNLGTRRALQLPVFPVCYKKWHGQWTHKAWWDAAGPTANHQDSCISLETAHPCCGAAWRGLYLSIARLSSRPRSILQWRILEPTGLVACKNPVPQCDCPLKRASVFNSLTLLKVRLDLYLLSSCLVAEDCTVWIMHSTLLRLYISIFSAFSQDLNLDYSSCSSLKQI